MNDVRTVLKGIPAFAALDDAEIEPLLQAFIVEEHPDGFVFAREGKRGDSAYLILDGMVAVKRQHAHGEDEVNRLERGALFGLVALVDNAPRSASCVAVGTVRVGVLGHGAFTLLFNTDGPVAYALQRAIGEQLAHDFRGLDRQIRDALAAK